MGELDGDNDSVRLVLGKLEGDIVGLKVGEVEGLRVGERDLKRWETGGDDSVSVQSTRKSFRTIMCTLLLRAQSRIQRKVT